MLTADFAIDADSGAITVADASQLNFEDASSHQITVEVTDAAGNTYEESFTINLTDVNETPTDLTLTGGVVAENATNGSTVGTIAAADVDLGDTASFQLTNDADGRFAIDTDTGAITVADASQLNFEDAASHQIAVEVTDAAGNTYEESFTINLTDVNEAPTDLTLTGGVVAENATNGSTVGTVAAADVDLGDVASFQLTDDADGRFAIDADSGAITVADASQLNFEDASSHQIAVEVTDAAGNTYEESFTINLTDVNEAPTDLTLTGGVVAENATNGSTVGTVAAADVDLGDVVSFQLTDDADGRFAIDADSGAITVADASQLNFEDASSHQITVEVTDAAGNTYEESFTINLTDVNEAPTDLTLTGGVVAEDAVNGTAVGTIAAADVDLGDAASFQLTNDADGRFEIDADSGAITVADASQLNFEDAANHQITVEVTDAGRQHLRRVVHHQSDGRQRSADRSDTDRWRGRRERGEWSYGRSDRRGRRRFGRYGQLPADQRRRWTLCNRCRHRRDHGRRRQPVEL